MILYLITQMEIKMKLSKTSWLYRFAKIGAANESPRENICLFARDIFKSIGSVAFVLMTVVTIVGIMVLGVGQWFVESPDYIIGLAGHVILGVILVITLMYFKGDEISSSLTARKIRRMELKAEKKNADQDKPVSGFAVVWTWMKSKHDKICTSLTFK